MKMVKTALALAGGMTFCAIASQTASAQAAFPDKCKAGMEMHGGMGGHDTAMSASADMPEHQKQSIEDMKTMNENMAQGMMKKDADVAFVCGMIAHHMGAINMAEVELKHGDNAEAKATAQKIIEAQTKEIEDLTAWVEREVK